MSIFTSRSRTAALAALAVAGVVMAAALLAAQRGHRSGAPFPTALASNPYAVRQSDATITIDFAEQLGPVNWVGSGFLNGLDAYEHPPDDRITPLKPQLWRDSRFWTKGDIGVDLYRRIRRFAPRVQFDMANSWMESRTGLPCQNWEAWSAHVLKVARDINANRID